MTLLNNETLVWQTNPRQYNWKLFKNKPFVVSTIFQKNEIKGSFIDHINYKMWIVLLPVKQWIKLTSETDCYNDFKSYKVTSRVPQEPNLGPRIFLIFMLLFHAQKAIRIGSLKTFDSKKTPPTRQYFSTTYY